MASKRKRSAKLYTRPEFRPYVTALGQLALAWNDLQEMLAVMFWTVMGTGERGLPLVVWYSLRSDRSQRDMLRAAVKALAESPERGRPRLWTDVKWLLDECEKLEDARNDALHSPLVWFGDSPLAQLTGAIPSVRPATFLGNPRADKLNKRSDLLAEFRWCRDKAITLADYAHLLELAISSQRYAWPEKPQLPNREQKSNRRDRRPRRSSAQRPRPPRSSHA